MLLTICLLRDGGDAVEHTISSIKKLAHRRDVSTAHKLINERQSVALKNGRPLAPFLQVAWAEHNGRNLLFRTI